MPPYSIVGELWQPLLVCGEFYISNVALCLLLEPHKQKPWDRIAGENINQASCIVLQKALSGRAIAFFDCKGTASKFCIEIKN